MKSLLTSVAFLLVVGAYGQKLTDPERALITSGAKDTPMRVLQTTDAADLKILRATSTDVTLRDKDPNLQLLIDRMLATVKDPASAGVGIAAPQVGINRNVIWVQRFDKQGEPFEAYLNPKITWRSELLRKGPEGCLSIPDQYGDVLRNHIIKITYYDRHGNYHEEMMEGFTAVIFQHETDHLMGILFTDRQEQQKGTNYSLINGKISMYLEHLPQRQ